MTVRKPQLFHSASMNELEKFVEDPLWSLEQKVDGMRCLTVITQDSVEFFTRDGKPLKSAAAKLHFGWMTDQFIRLQSLYGTPFEIVLDGEILPDQSTLVLLDLPYMQTNGVVTVSPEMYSSERYSRMRDIWQSLTASLQSHVTKTGTIVPVRRAETTAEKARLVKDVIEGRHEGFIAKQYDSPYNEGERVKHSVKIKLTTTADVVVLDKNSGESKHSKRGGDKINYVFGVWSHEQADYIHLGNCSGIGKEDADIGDVIEVEYLYVGAGGKLVQPRMLRKRDDKKWFQCTSEQLKHYSKAVL